MASSARSDFSLGDEIKRLEDELEVLRSQENPDEDAINHVAQRIQGLSTQPNDCTKFESLMMENRSKVRLPKEIEEEEAEMSAKANQVAPYVSIPVMTNSFPARITIDPNEIVYKYDIRFEDDNSMPNSNMKEDFLILIENEIRDFIGFDQAMSYDANRLFTFVGVEEFTIERYNTRVRFEPSKDQAYRWDLIKRQHKMGLLHNFLKTILHGCGLQKNDARLL